MNIKMQVLAEDVRVVKNVEYVTVTGMEVGDKPLLQMFDYGLRAEEMSHKGKLVGKVMDIHVECVRNIFSGRPQFSGKIVSVPK